MKWIAGLVASLGMLVGLGAPAAQAATADDSWNVPYGQLYVSAYECNSFVTACNWKTKVQLRNNGGKLMDSITNTTTVSANGISAKVTLSKDQSSAVLSGNQTQMGKVTWTKYKSNLVELSGTAKPTWTAIGITTKACVTGNGPGTYGAVSAKCAQIGLW